MAQPLQPHRGEHHRTGIFGIANKIGATATGLCAGVHCVTVTDTQGSTGTSCDSVYLNTGIRINNHEDIVSVHPNPFSTAAIVSFANATGDLHVAEIFDMTGKSVRTISTTNDQLVFHRQQLASGLYFLQLKTTDAVIATRKILIE